MPFWNDVFALKPADYDLYSSKPKLKVSLFNSLVLNIVPSKWKFENYRKSVSVQ